MPAYSIIDSHTHITGTGTRTKPGTNTPKGTADGDVVVNNVLRVLLGGRKQVEDAGYRADSCLLASTDWYRLINLIDVGQFVADELLNAANVNSLYRATQLDEPNNTNTPNGYLLMVGRRQQIAHRGAAEASPGEEPIDLAVSLPPSLEIVGDDVSGRIELGVRIRFALRIKDQGGFVVLIANDLRSA